MQEHADLCGVDVRKKYPSPAVCLNTRGAEWIAPFHQQPQRCLSAVRPELALL